MQIFVNDQVLEAELAGERDLSQVYEEIQKWSSDHQKYILEMKVDSEEVSLSSLKEIALDAVQRVDFYIGDEMEMVLTTVDELDRYIDQVGSTLFNTVSLDAKEAKDLLDGVHWIRQIFSSLSGILHMDLSLLSPGFSHSSNDSSTSVESVLQHMEAQVRELQGGAGQEQLQEFLENLRHLKQFVMRLHLQLRAMHADGEELTTLVKEFEDNIPDLAQEAVSINVEFNGGRDAGALQALDAFTEKLHLYISALHALDYRFSGEQGHGIMKIEHEGIPFQMRSATLTELLHDLSSALEENDIVAAGDILEYELPDRLQELLPYLSQIRQLMLAGK